VINPCNKSRIKIFFGLSPQTVRESWTYRKLTQCHQSLYGKPRRNTLHSIREVSPLSGLCTDHPLINAYQSRHLTIKLFSRIFVYLLFHLQFSKAGPDWIGWHRVPPRASTTTARPPLLFNAHQLLIIKINCDSK